MLDINLYVHIASLQLPRRHVASCHVLPFMLLQIVKFRYDQLWLTIDAGTTSAVHSHHNLIDNLSHYHYKSSRSNSVPIEWHQFVSGCNVVPLHSTQVHLFFFIIHLFQVITIDHFPLLFFLLIWRSNLIKYWVLPLQYHPLIGIYYRVLGNKRNGGIRRRGHAIHNHRSLVTAYAKVLELKILRQNRRRHAHKQSTWWSILEILNES